MPRIALILPARPPDGPAPVFASAALSAATARTVAALRAGGARVELIVASGVIDLGALRPTADLYVLKSKSPFALSLAAALEARGARIVNSAAASSLARDKIAATGLLAAAGVPVPPTWATGRAAVLTRLAAAGGALWIKPCRGSRGDGVQKVSDAWALETWRDPSDPHGLPLPVLAQADVPSSGRDLKVYVVGQRAWAIKRRWPARTLKEKLGDPVPLPAAVREAALTVGRVLGLELFGIDVLTHDERLWVVDVNAYPGFKGVPEAPRAIAEYLLAAAPAELARSAAS